MRGSCGSYELEALKMGRDMERGPLEARVTESVGDLAEMLRLRETWDPAILRTSVRAMFDYCRAEESKEYVLKEIAFGFWYVEWLFSVELDYLRRQAGLPEAEIAAVKEVLNELSYWLFIGECSTEIQQFRDRVWAL